MRWNLQKLTGVGVVLGLLWLLLFYSSFIQAPKAFNNKFSVEEVELRLEQLEKQLDSQLIKSNKLLEKIKRLKPDYREEYPYGKDEFNSGTSPVLPVLVIACDRVTVSRCLEKLIKFRPSTETFPIIVSQDCSHNKTYQVIKSFVDKYPSVSVVTQPDQSPIPLPRAKVKFSGYYKIARHFRFALNYVLEKLEHEAVIIVEDDLDISPDFFEYFLGTYPILVKDPSLWCVSAWNDNGKRDLCDLSHPELLHRTDFFPGLGWMLRRSAWAELAPRWPAGFFDDWLRDPVNTHGKSCIRPEISRTYTFGKVGVSKGLFFDVHLRAMHLNTEVVEFTKLDLSYLLKENYDSKLTSTVHSLPVVKADEVMSELPQGEPGAVRVTYSDAASFRKAAKTLGLMDEFRSGVPRTAYRGIVSCYIQGRRVYLVPDFEWTAYDPSWG